MDHKTRLDWENRFMEATGRIPPGRDVPALKADTPGIRTSSEELAWWIVHQQQAELERLKLENGQLLDLTRELNEHPDDYDGPCLCKLCLSYGD